MDSKKGIHRGRIFERILQSQLSFLLDAYPNVKLNVIEIGCMFSETEKLSTLAIAEFLKNSNRKFNFVSIDIDAAHINRAKAILCDVDKTLIDAVAFIEGNSLKVLPELLKSMKALHLVLLDGSGDPELNLKEYGIIQEKLLEKSVVVIDDIWDMPPTVNYSRPRPFGKGTAILPELVKNKRDFVVIYNVAVIGNHLRHNIMSPSMSYWEFLKETFEKIVLFGAGKYLVRFAEAFNLNKDFVAAIYDDAPPFSEFNGIPVLPSPELKKLDSRIPVILCTDTWQDEMRRAIKRVNPELEIIDINNV